MNDTRFLKPKNSPWKTLNIIKAVIIRLLFFIHSILTLIWFINVLQDNWYWFLSLWYVLAVVEGIYNIRVRRGTEHSWISTCILWYILTTIPSLWNLQLNRVEFTKSSNSTNLDVINVYIDKVTWTNALEQAFLLMIIFGRWLLPKGRISHSELSQLLLTFIGKACDITDFFQIFSETTVKQNTSLTYAILSIWTISLFQFPFVLTATKMPTNSDPSLGLNLIFETEIWSILVHILMQEFPFMIIRWLIIIKFNVLNYSILFFALKNVLLLVMYIYRLYSILRPIVENANERKEQPGSIATVSATSADNIVEVSEIDSEMI